MKAHQPQRRVAATLLTVWSTCCVFWPSTASAELSPGPVAVVAVAGAQGDRNAADTLAAPLVSALAGREVFGPAAVRQKLSGRRADSIRARGDRLSTRGRRALQAFQDLEHTATLLTGAAEAYLSILPLLDSIDTPLGLLHDLSTVTLALGDQQRTLDALTQVARFDPVLQLDPAEVPGRLISAADQARDAARDLPLLTTEAAQQIATEVGARHLIVVQPRPTATHALVELYDGETGVRSQRWEVAAAATAGVAATLIGSSPPPVLDPEIPGVIADDEDPEPEPPPTPGTVRPWYRRWWVWTIVGVVVAGGAAAGAAVAITQNRPDTGMEVYRRW